MRKFWIIFMVVFAILLIPITVNNASSGNEFNKKSTGVITKVAKTPEYIVIKTNKSYTYVIRNVKDKSTYRPPVDSGDSVFEYWSNGQLSGIGLNRELNLFEVLERK